MVDLEVVKEGSKFRIGGGNSVNFWNDIWIDGTSLYDCLLTDIHLDDTSLKVADLLTSDSKWMSQRLVTLLPDELVHKISGVPVSLDRQCTDKLIWRFTTSGNFSVKSTYNMLDVSVTPLEQNWSWIWNTKGLEKVKTLLWLACWGRCHTQRERHKRSLVDSDICLLCLEE